MLNSLIEKIRKDDLLHIICNILLMKVFNLFIPLWLTIVIVVTIDLLKEFVWDKKLNRGTFEWRDLISDAIGIIIALIP